MQIAFVFTSPGVQRGKINPRGWGGGVEARNDYNLVGGYGLNIRVCS